ncbi:hypothetical protein AB1286_23850 [Trinickia sp. NRRL B-1857]|uniref:hypothetical protein n=1 Tax=Trinickia sp. NRRL B-1857 TaxID=3162879 RepID=UPI003D2858E9
MSFWFAAYEFGWESRAFALPADLAQRELGALDAAERQLTLAFELGRQRIAGAIATMNSEYEGKRISLKADDLRSWRDRQPLGKPSRLLTGFCRKVSDAQPSQFCGEV